MQSGFRDRVDAGQKLAATLRSSPLKTPGLVLAIPRGGVPVAYEIASALKLPLDLILARKLGVPGQEEFAMGAVASDGSEILDNPLIASLGLTAETVSSIAKKERRTLIQREKLFRRGLGPPAIQGMHVILVDDGLATGSSFLAALSVVRALNPLTITAAIPVAPSSAIEKIRPWVDSLKCLLIPHDFYAVGQWYEDFAQVDDAEVIRLLARSKEIDFSR